MKKFEIGGNGGNFSTTRTGPKMLVLLLLTVMVAMVGVGWVDSASGSGNIYIELN